MAEQIPVNRIIPHPLNPRTQPGDIDGLAHTIALHGTLQAVLVCHHPHRPGWYLLLAGWRRWLAAKQAGLTHVPGEIRPVPNTSDRARIVMLVENDQREGLDLIDRARAYGELRKGGMTVKHIAIAVGRSQSTISYHLSLLDLDEASQQRVRDGLVTAGQAHEAVTATRANRSVDRGGTPRRKTVTEPPWFTRRHPLAGIVRAMCGHTTRPRLGGAHGVGCGQCWEQAIRADARSELSPPPVDLRPAFLGGKTMTMAWEHEVRLYGAGGDINGEPDEGVTARCTCGSWAQTFSDSIALDTVGELAFAHMATHPQPPRVCALRSEGCDGWSVWTILHGPGDHTAHEACSPCLGTLVVACSAGDDETDGSVVVLPHPVYDGQTVVAEPAP